MRNLEEFGVKELNSTELELTEGGSPGLILIAVGLILLGAALA